MLLYLASRSQFNTDVLDNTIEQKILSQFERKLGRRTGKSEILSWQNSMQYMNNVLAGAETPADSTVAIEYKIPVSSKRIDFILAGQDRETRDSLVVVELKQWETVEKTEKDGIVLTQLGRGVRETPHPSYQSWTYVELLKQYNTYIQDHQIQLTPCTYLHNCKDGTDLRDPFYQEHLDKAPVFLRTETADFQKLIRERVVYGDRSNLMEMIDGGKIRPSKNLADHLASLLSGNQEFLMIDDQKIVFETALQLAKESSARKKKVYIVQGGPGSGKSVVAVNLLVRFTQEQKTAKYVTKNAAPRTVYEQKLVGSFKKSHISSLFVGSGAFYDCEKNSFDALIVDEGHRLNQKSGLFSNKGENQIKEIIQSSLSSTFFIDEDQVVTLKDIGKKNEIERVAQSLGAEIHYGELKSQFRCNGSDAYLAWLDQSLGIRETNNTTLSESDYDFKVLDDPSELQALILRLNESKNRARIVAGYCWEWKSKKDPKAWDIELGDRFRAKWNLASYGSSWIIHPESVKEVGCIHTCQGLEVDHIGVILGPDLLVRNGQVVTNVQNRARSDQSVKGHKKLLQSHTQETEKRLDLIIKNTYKTLMTRGSQSCYLYSEDQETREYFKSVIQGSGK